MISEYLLNTSTLFTSIYLLNSLRLWWSLIVFLWLTLIALNFILVWIDWFFVKEYIIEVSCIIFFNNITFLQFFIAFFNTPQILLWRSKRSLFNRGLFERILRLVLLMNMTTLFLNMLTIFCACLRYGLLQDSGKFLCCN